MAIAAGKVQINHWHYGEMTIFVEQHASIPYQWDCEVEDTGDRFDIDADSLREAIAILKDEYHVDPKPEERA